MRSYLYIFLSGICIVLSSCKKETLVIDTEQPQETQDCACTPLLDPSFSGGCGNCDIDLDESYYDFPVINPNNANEFAYVDNVFPNSKLMFYNMGTNEKRVLFNDDVSGNLSWSRKDWILFQRTSDLNLYKIKSNGDSLTQLTYEGNLFHAQWNYSGEKFIAYNKFKNYPRTDIMDENGVKIDSLTNWEHRAGNWSHPTYYLGASTSQLIVMDIESKSVVKQLSLEEQISFATWVSLNEIMYRKGTGIYTFNLSTNETILIRCECHKYLAKGTFSSDFSKLLFVRIEDSLQANNRIFEDSKLILMQKDGTGELEILP